MTEKELRNLAKSCGWHEWLKTRIGKGSYLIDFEGKNIFISHNFATCWPYKLSELERCKETYIIGPWKDISGKFGLNLMTNRLQKWKE